MTARPPAYVAEFSHRYDAGPSGPARQYWDIVEVATRARTITVCLNDTEHAESEARSICHALSSAREKGRSDLKADLRALLL